MSRTAKEIRTEMRQIGRIIDERSMKGLPFWSYVREYNKLKEELQEAKEREVTR
jgi:hypothetical protein